MARGMDTARRTGTTVPRIQEIAYETGETFKKFAVVVLNANGNVEECDDNPTSVTGLALNGIESLPGYNVANDDQVLVRTGTRAKVSVAIADKEQEFSARGVSGGTDPVTPLQSHIGKQYAVKKVVDDWVIDIANVSDVSVQVTDIRADDGVKMFLFKWLDSVMTVP